MNDPRATAVHESGHVVCARLCGVKVHCVKLHPEGGGTASLEALPDDERGLRVALLTLASGELAERMVPWPAAMDWAL